MKKTMLIAAIAVVATILPLAGCGHSKPVAKSAPSTPCDVATPECLAKTKTTSYIPVPTAKIGQPIRFAVPSQNGAVNLEFTATRLWVKPGTSDDKPGTVTVCVSGKLANVGSMPVAAGDAAAQTGAIWFGLDGQQSEPDPGVIGRCGSGTVWAGIDQPAVQSGRHVVGTWMYSVPSAPGAIEVTDSTGHPLYRLDYGPQSAQVKINTVGQ